MDLVSRDDVMDVLRRYCEALKPPYKHQEERDTLEKIRQDVLRLESKGDKDV